MKYIHKPHNRLIAALLLLVCLLGLLPTTAMAATPDTIKMDDCAYNGVKYDSPALGECYMHQMHFGLNGKSTMGFCAEKGKGMGWSLKGHTWGNPKPISDPTVKTMMAYFYAHSTGVFTDRAIALGENAVWNSNYTWTMNAWTQAIVWRYKAGLLADPVTACAEELMCVYNNLEHTNYTSIDDLIDGISFRDRVKYILDLGAEGVWGECEVYEYAYTGPGSSYHPSNDVQAVMVGELSVIRERYGLTVRKVDSTNPNKGLPGARFLVASENGAYSKEIVTGQDGTYTLSNLEAGTYAVTELEPPADYEIDNAGPQYVVLPSGSDKTVTVIFTDTPVITGEGSIRKVDADDPTKGLAGAVIKITGVDNDFTGTYVTGVGGYLTDVPWKDMPIGSFTAEEVTPPEGYTKSPDVSKTKQTFVWDGKTDVALVFENDAKVKVKLIKLDDSDNPLPGAVFNIIKDGQIIGTEATKADGSITVTDVTEGMYAFVEVSAPSPYAALTDPVIAHVDQATINGGGTVTVTASDKKLPSLTILKRDAKTGDVIPNTHFEIKGIHYGYHNDVTTGPGGRAVLTNIPVDSYEVTEKSVPDPYVVSEEPTQTIWLEAGDNKELIFDNQKQPLLKSSKIEKGTGKPIPGTVFLLEAIDGDYRHEVTTEANGSVELRVAPGSYRVTEKSVQEPYVISDNPTQTISLNGGDEKEIIFENLKKPELTLSKIDADTQKPIPGTVLRVEAINGDYQDDWTTGADGKVTKYVAPGTYRVTEISVPAPWYLPDKDADRVQTISLNPGDAKELVFRNRKSPEITIFKEDSVAGAPIEGAKFHVTYTSTGEAAEAPASADYGYLFTDANGEIKLHEKGKKLYPGEFTITEVAPAPGFQMKEPITQTVIIHGNESKTVTFQNEPLNAIIVEKYDSVTHEALPGCTFQLRYLGGTSGTGGTVIGQKVTGKNGTCIWTGLKSGTYVVEEVDPADGYSIINSSETVYLADSGEQSVVTVRFDNAPDGNLLIRKVCSVNPSIPLQDAEFKVMYADGTLIGDGNGIYRSDENGEVRISGLKPGKSVVVTEVRAPDGFILDTQSQTIQIKEGRTVTLTFKNQPRGSLIIQKRDSISGQPLPGAQFRVTTAAGCEVGLDGVIGTATLTSNGIFTTDSNGEIRISNLAPGALILTEIQAPAGYVIDNPSTNVVIGPNGDTQTVIVTNTPKGGLIVEKYDSVTKLPLAGAQFKIIYSNGELLPDNEGLTSSNGLYTTNDKGEIRISGVTGTIVVKEVKAAPGYVIDQSTQTQTVTVNPEDTQTLVFLNEPLCSLTLKKLDSVTGKPIPNTEFTVKDGNGNVLGRYTTGKDGTVTVSGLVPGSTVVVSESKVPSGYVLNTTPQTIIVKNGSNTLSIGGTGTAGGNNGGTGVGGGTGDGNDLVFENDPKTRLIIEKYITGTTTPLQGVTFLVTESNGQVVGNSNGEFVTDENGRIVIEGLEPGVTIIAKEIRTLEGYVLDSTPKSIKIEVGDAQTLRFFNAKQGTIVIRKLDKQTNEPLAGVEFQITYSDGSYLDDDYGHLSSKGLYKTDANGEIRISGVVGTLVITETKPLPGYVMDEGTKTQTVRVNATDTQTITVYNTRSGGLTIIKKDEETGARIKGVEFEVRKLNGEIIGTYTTDARGVINLPQAEKGWYQVVELKAAKGYKLDDTPHQIEVKDGGTATLEITNRQSGSALIHKIDSVTGKGIYGVKFLLSDAKGNPVGTYESDNEGYVYIDKELADGRYTIREIECAEGYILDTQPKTVYVEYGGCTTITWKNTAITGQIQVWKKSADDNAINGFPAGTPLEGAVFEIYDKANRLVDTIKSDRRGLAVSKQLPLGRYTLKEVTSPAYYSPASEAATVYLEHEGQIVQIEVLNKSVYTHVSVRKSGYTQVVPGQSIRYTFKEIGNNSTVSLDNFFWRDTLPTDAVRLDKIITGTWSAKLTYKAVFRTNVNGEYRTLADNLDTQRSYTLDASPAALGLASNEYVTEVMFLLGRVPAGFKQMQTPYIYCNVLSSVAHEYRFANKTDVGGTWQGQWIMANDRWVTIVYRGGPTPTLPRTGY